MDMTEDFTTYDVKPEAFLNYLRYYGPHFNKKLCDFACELLGGKQIDKDKLDEILKTNGVLLKDAKLHDSVFVANWCKRTFYGSSITTEKQMTAFIKDVFEKEGDLIFNRWYADMAKRGIPIEWDDMI